MCQIPPQSTAAVPPPATAAPTSPPINACEDEEGNPNRQVKRFHAIAPKSAASSTCRLTSPFSSPFPTVSATAVQANAPARFMTAAINTAVRGASARVETLVATALAVS